MRIAIATAALLAVLPAAGLGQERAQRIAAISQAVGASVADLEKRLATPGGDPSIRDLPNAALATLIISKDGHKAEALLRTEFAQQNMDTGSPDFGNLPWQIGHPEIHDANAIEFGMQSIGPIWHGHGDLLDAGFKQEMLPHLKAALAAIHRHDVQVIYTNIFLMKAVNLILVGEAAGDAEAARDGYTMLDTWMARTREAGIREFDSPTYYAVDLSSLAMGYRYAARPEARVKFKTILDFVWRDIGANYFPARGTLSGPHSRDYDFLRGTGDLDIYLYAEGYRIEQELKKVNLEKALLLEAVAGYQPPASDLATLPEKVVTQRWDIAPGAQRYNYITPDFAMGSTSGDYGPQDKLFAIELAKGLPVISVVPDTYDHPYGLLKIKGTDGHSKARHIQIHLEAVQRKGAALLLVDLDPRKEANIESLATNILLPANADQLTLNGKTITASPSLSAAASNGAVIGVREGNAGVAIRVFTADGCAGQAPAMMLKADPEGIEQGAVRLAIYHYRGSARTLDDPHARVGLLAIAAHCETEAAFEALLAKVKKAPIDQDDAGGIWKVRASLPDATLEAARDLTHRTLLYQRVNGKDMETAPLSVNGKDIGLK